MSDTESDTASSVGEILEDVSEADTTTFKCLFCEEQWSRVPDMFTHCNKEHGFDVENTIKKLGQGQSCKYTLPNLYADHVRQTSMN
jgi:protein arginine N-methyltransferase 3